MTAFTPGSGGSIPSDATTLEKAAIWVFEEARRLQPVGEYTIVPGSPAVKVAETSVNTIPGYTNPRFTGIAFVALDDNYLNITGKHWVKVLTGKWIDSNSPNGATETFLPGTGGSIPSSVDTFPKALIWMSQAFEQVNYLKTVIETPYDPNTGTGGDATLMAISQPIRTFDHGMVNFCRVSIPVDRDWANLGQALYKSALVESNVAIGSSLTTN